MFSCVGMLCRLDGAALRTLGRGGRAILHLHECFMRGFTGKGGVGGGAIVLGHSHDSLSYSLFTKLDFCEILTFNSPRCTTWSAKIGY